MVDSQDPAVLQCPRQLDDADLKLLRHLRPSAAAMQLVEASYVPAAIRGKLPSGQPFSRVSDGLCLLQPDRRSSIGSVRRTLRLPMGSVETTT